MPRASCPTRSARQSACGGLPESRPSRAPARASARRVFQKTSGRRMDGTLTGPWNRGDGSRIALLALRLWRDDDLRTIRVLARRELLHATAEAVCAIEV